MFTVSSGVFVHFGHHVRGHDGPCISLHGHTWKLEVGVGAEELDETGFVIDFDRLQAQLLGPCHTLLDHALAVGEATWQQTAAQLAQLGTTLVQSRELTIGGLGELPPALEHELHGARNELPGGMKVAVFPFTPTSERLAKWLFELTQAEIADERVRVVWARVFETMHPVELVAEYRP